MSEVLRYIDPPESVTSGRKLGSYWKHSVLMTELRQGEHLYAYIDRYTFKQARLVDDVREFDDVDIQYKSGYIKVLGYYAIFVPSEPESTATTLSDEPLPTEQTKAPPTGG